MQNKFSVKVDAQMVNELSVALREAECEGKRIALGVENAQRRLSELLPRLNEGRQAVTCASQRLRDLCPAAREDSVLAALVAPLEGFVQEAVDTLAEMEDWHDDESQRLLSLEGKAAANRTLCAALGAALAACEVEGEAWPVDDTGVSSVW